MFWRRKAATSAVIDLTTADRSTEPGTIDLTSGDPTTEPTTVRCGPAPVYFLHIMKTAGRALADVIIRPMGERAPGSAMVSVLLDDFVVLPEDTWERVRFISGHLSFEALDLLPAGTTTVTVLRDPVERTLSHYSHIRTAPEVVAEWGELRLEDFLTAERWRGVVVDYQARHLAHRIGLAEAHRTFSPAERFAELGPPFPESHADPLQSLFDCGPTVSRDELRPVAFANLAAVDVVGTTDQLDGVAAAMAGLLDLPAPSVALKHPTPDRLRRDDVDPELLDLIAELTELDAELVAEARSRGEQLVASQSGRSRLAPA